MYEDKVVLKDSERELVPGSRELGPAKPDETIRVTVYVRPKGAPIDVDRLGAMLPGERKYLGDTEFYNRYGASQSDLQAVEKFAEAHGLQVIESRPERRSVLLSGPVSKMSAAFGVELKEYAHSNGNYRGRTGPVRIPKELEGIVQGVFGLDNRKLGRSYLRRHPRARAAATLDSSQLQPGTFIPFQLAPIYDFPQGDGTGETIGIFTFNDGGGGYDTAALQEYFTANNLPVPQITNVVVQGPGNTPDGSDTSVEVMLDIQVSASLAPGAKFNMYFTTFTEQGWVDVISAATMDANPPSVISISYGNPEVTPTAWTKSAITQVNQSFQAASARGVTICVASGDEGSFDATSQSGAVLKGTRVDFPASSPYVLGVGGTSLVASGSQITSEVVWDDLKSQQPSAGGGGISVDFGLPTWQQGIPFLVNPPKPHSPGRGVPDVCANADPNTGYNIIVDVFNNQGQKTGTQIIPVGGTSASTPLWAALIARLNQNLGTPLGYFNPLLYGKLNQGVLNDIVEGTNGAYQAGPGWDACTGFGSPNGAQLLKALQGAATVTS
jgi:kumamolisin